MYEYYFKSVNVNTKIFYISILRINTCIIAMDLNNSKPPV